MMSKLDYPQVIKSSYDEESSALKIKQIGGNLVPESYDEIELTYVTAGNGIGEIETVVYKNASVTVATLTLSYNSDNKLQTVLRS